MKQKLSSSGPGKDEMEAFTDAAENGDNETIKKFLRKYPAAINAQNLSSQMSAMDYAVWKGHTETVALLIEKGADIETKNRRNGWTPLMNAARWGHNAIIKLLLKRGAPIDGEGCSVMVCAVLSGKLETVKLVLKSGANPDRKDSSTRSPLMLAKQLQRVEIAKFLEMKDAWLLSEDIADFSPSLKRTIPAPSQLKPRPPKIK